jgi:hypothetical protein
VATTATTRAASARGAAQPVPAATAPRTGRRAVQEAVAAREAAAAQGAAGRCRASTPKPMAAAMLAASGCCSCPSCSSAARAGSTCRLQRRRGRRRAGSSRSCTGLPALGRWAANGGAMAVTALLAGPALLADASGHPHMLALGPKNPGQPSRGAPESLVCTRCRCCDTRHRHQQRVQAQLQRLPSGAAQPRRRRARRPARQSRRSCRCWTGPSTRTWRRCSSASGSWARSTAALRAWGASWTTAPCVAAGQQQQGQERQQQEGRTS